MLKNLPLLCSDEASTIGLVDLDGNSMNTDFPAIFVIYHPSSPLHGVDSIFDSCLMSYLSSDQLLVSLPPLPVRLFLFPIPFNISTLPETFSALLPSLRFSRKQHGMSSIWFFKHNIFFYQLQQICILCLMWQVYLSVRKGCRSLHENRSDHFQRG